MSSHFDHGGDIFSMARQLGTTASGITDFSASINPLGVSPQVRQAIIDALDSLIHYPDAGHQEFKQTLADYHGLSPASIVAANGSTELIYRLPSLIACQNALIVAPAFSEYRHALDQHHVKVSHFILAADDGFTLDPKALEHALGKGYDAVYLCNPGNPSGRLYPLRLVEQVYRLCRAAGAFLVLDEAFMDFCEEASAKQIIAAGENAVILRSMTKFFAIPGLRLGYAIANESLAGRLTAMGAPWNVNTLALTAGETAIRDTAYNLRSVAFIREEREYLMGQLSRFPMLTVYPSAANYLLINITNGLTAHVVRQRLLSDGLLIRDCANFTGLTPHFFRVAVRTREENLRLVAGLHNILNQKEA